MAKGVPVKKWMKKKGLSAYRLAMELGLDRSTISKTLSGRVCSARVARMVWEYSGKVVSLESLLWADEFH